MSADDRRIQVPNPGSAAQAEALFGSLSPKKVGRRSLARSVSFPAFHQRAENSRYRTCSYRDPLFRIPRHWAHWVVENPAPGSHLERALRIGIKWITSV